MDRHEGKIYELQYIKLYSTRRWDSMSSVSSSVGKVKTYEIKVSGRVKQDSSIGLYLKRMKLLRC